MISLIARSVDMRLEIHSRLPIVAYYIATFFMGLANFTFDNIFNFYLDTQGVPPDALGRIYGVATLVMAVTVVPLLALKNTLQQGTLLIVGSLIYAIPYVAIPFVTDELSATVVLSLVLSGMLVMLSAGNAIAGSSVSESNHTRLFAGFFVVHLGAGMVASIVSALSTQGIESDADAVVRYRILLVVAAASAIVMLLFRYYSLPDKGQNNRRRTFGDGSTAAERASAPRRANLSSSEIRRLIVLSGSAFLLGASMALIFRFSNLLLLQAYSLPISQISTILALDKLVSIAGAIIVPFVVARFSARLASLVFGILVFVSLSVQALAPPLVVFVLLYLFRLVLNYGQMPLLDAGALQGIKPGNFLVASGARQGMFYLGGAAAAAMYGEFLNLGNWHAAVWISALTALGGSLLLALLHSGFALRRK